MKRNLTRLLSIPVTLTVCLCLFIISASAKNYVTDMHGSDYTSGTLAERLETIFYEGISGCVTPSIPKVGQSLDNSTQYVTTYEHNSGTSSDYQCVAYARAAYSYLFGYNVGAAGSRTEFTSAIAKNELTYELFKEYGIRCGAYLRTTNRSNGDWNGKKGGGHSLLILGYDSSGITTLEGNELGNGEIRVVRYTWSEFNGEELSGRGRYVCSLAQPFEETYADLVCPHSNGYQNAQIDGNYTATCKDCGNEYICTLDTLTSGTYRVVSNTAPCRTAPYKAAPSELVSKGDTLTVIGSTTNAFIKLWYKLDSGRWVHAEHLQLVSAAASNLTVTGVQAPSGTLTKGQSFSLRGVINSSPYVLKNVSAQIAKSNGTAVMSYSQNLSDYDYNIRYDGLNTKFTFGTLAAGSYTYTVKATDVKGTTKTLISSSFTIAAPACTSHTKGTFQFFETAHPHYNYYKCETCGELFTDGTTVASSDCEDCNHLTVAPTLTTIRFWPYDNLPGLKWTSVDRATGYEIWRSSRATDSFSVISTASSTEFTDYSAVPGTTYYYTVRAINSTSASPYSETLSSTCKCPAPKVSFERNPTSGLPRFTWTAVEGADSYALYRSETQNNFQKIRILSGSTDYDITDSTATLGKTYYYQLEAVCSQNNDANNYFNGVMGITTPAAPAITTQSKNISANEGATAKFTVKATGENLTYQWQYRTSSTGTWKSALATGNKTATLSVPATASRNGFQYRCVVTDKYGNTATSNAVTLTVVGPSITTQPKNITANKGTTAKFTLKASGMNLTYQWQYRTSSSGTWQSATAAGNKTATMSVPATANRNGFQYRCVVTNGAGSTVTSKAVTLKVVTLGITTQPKNITADKGTTAKFTVKANGVTLTYQWQYRTSSTGTWYNATAAGNKTATLSVPATASRNGWQYRCVVTNGAGSTVTSKAVTLKVVTLGVTTQPRNITADKGTTAKFTVKANGVTLTYQWQYRTSSSGTWQSATAAGNKTATLSVPATVSRDGFQYRCVITNGSGETVTSKAVTLKVIVFEITAQPKSVSAAEGTTAKFTVKATGSELTYQWKYRTSSSGSWKNATAAGNQTATLSVPATVSRDGFQYRCEITDANDDTVISKIVTLTIS